MKNNNTSKPTLVKPEAIHCKQLAENIRVMDALEMYATNYFDLPNEELLKVYLELSDVSYAVVSQGKCLALCGIRIKGEEGIPWLIMSDGFLEKHRMFFLRNCGKYLRKNLGGIKYLYNFIATQNTKTQDWLEWMGFSILKGKPMNVRGVDFYKFEMEVANV